MAKVWVLTSEYNDYDQYGEYFEAAFRTSPTLQQLSQIFYETDIDQLTDDELMFLTHIKRGGGREKVESKWYYLREVKEGEAVNKQ